MFALVVILVCLALNAALACIEMAFVSVGRAEIRERARKGEGRAALLLKFREHPERVLSVLQIGITLVGAISAAVGGAGAEENLAPILQAHFDLHERAADVLAIAIVVVPLTYFSVVLGELVPKTIALRHGLTISLLSVRYLRVADRVLSPFVWFLEKSTKLILAMIPRSAPDTNKNANADDVLALGDLHALHRQYIVNLARLEGKVAADSMIPWDKVDRVVRGAPVQDVLDKVVRSGHTRLPVVDSIGRVEGLLHTKEFIALVTAGADQWDSILRPPHGVRPGDGLLMILRRFQQERRHLAVVGRLEDPLGIVTLEDIIEEVIGEIADEDDDGFLQRLISQRRI